MIWYAVISIYVGVALGAFLIGIFTKTPSTVRPHERLLAALTISVFWPVAIIGMILWPASDRSDDSE